MMLATSTASRFALVGVLVLLTLPAAGQEPTDTWPRLLPTPEVLTQLALSEIEAEEQKDKSADDTTRSLICRAWLYQDNEAKALQCAMDGSRFDKSANLALLGLPQDQISILGHPPRVSLADVAKLTDEADWFWPFSVVHGYLDVGRPEQALRHLPDVPINKGTFGPVLPQILRLARQLKARDNRDAVVKLAKGVLSDLEKHRPTPSDDPILASFAKVCQEMQEPALAIEFRRCAIVINNESRSDEVSHFSVFRLMQAALANHVTGDIDEAQRQLDQAIRLCDQIMRGDEVSDHDLSDRYETLLKMAVRLHEFGLPKNSLHCLLSAADYASRIESPLFHDGASHRLAETARDLGHPELAQQYSDRIQRPGYKLVDLRRQVERLQTNSRIDEARQVLESAERLAMQHTDDEFHVGETAELGLSRALLGDVDRSHEHFQRALRLSREQNQDFHQLIARRQVKAGQFQDAYQTLREMASRRFRVYALAELAQAVAKQDYERRRK